jgi:hypothetical protein
VIHACPRCTAPSASRSERPAWWSATATGPAPTPAGVASTGGSGPAGARPCGSRASTTPPTTLTASATTGPTPTIGTWPPPGPAARRLHLGRLAVVALVLAVLAFGVSAVTTHAAPAPTAPSIVVVPTTAPGPAPEGYVPTPAGPPATDRNGRWTGDTVKHVTWPDSCTEVTCPEKFKHGR